MICKGCKQDKSEADFYRYRLGLRGKCKQCMSDDAKERRLKAAQRVGHNQRNLSMPSQEELKDLFDYHPDGCFIRKKARGTQKVGSICRGKREDSGYRRMPINHNLYLAHRLIWKWHNGTEPEFLDHINRNRDDNRIENIRQASKNENCRHQGIPANNTSGYIGVGANKSKHGGAWIASIAFNGNKISLGYYPSIKQAVMVYNDACAKLHGEFGKDKIEHNLQKLREDGFLE